MNKLQGKQYQKNARKIDQKRLDDLKRYIADYGDLSGIILNLENGEYVGGNQRSKVMQEAGKLVDMVQLDEPDAVGTVAYGFVEYQGNRFAYREVRWDEIRHAKASIVANNAGGENDLDLLIQHHAEILDDVGLTERDLEEIGEKQNFVLPADYVDSYMIDTGKLVGKKILLVDDVITSGATITHFAETLEALEFEVVMFGLGVRKTLKPEKCMDFCFVV